MQVYSIDIKMQTYIKYAEDRKLNERVHYLLVLRHN